MVRTARATSARPWLAWTPYQTASSEMHVHVDVQSRPVGTVCHSLCSGRPPSWPVPSQVPRCPLMCHHSLCRAPWREGFRVLALPCEQHLRPELAPGPKRCAPFSGRDPALCPPGLAPGPPPGLPDSLPRFAELTDVRDDGEGSRAPPGGRASSQREVVTAMSHSPAPGGLL